MCCGFLGHTVLRENHIGDWGTPFGMLIEYLLEVDGAERAESFSVRDLNEFYTAARTKFDAEPDFAERCRSRVVLLQGGDEETLRLWRIFVAESMRHAGEVYALLGVLLTPEDIVGESYYNPFLPVVVDELTEKGLLVENDGALCVFPPGFENRKGEPLPLIVRKSDGGYGYPATDLAAVARPDQSARGDEARLRRRGRAGPAPASGLRRGRHGRLPRRRRRSRACRFRHGARDGRQEAGQPQRRLRTTDRPALRRGGTCGQGHEGPRQRVGARGAGRRWLTPSASGR